MDLQDRAVPRPDKGCHRAGFARKCADLVGSGECGRWHSETVAVPGEAPRVMHGCEDTWALQFQRETVINVAGVQAATESFRNEMVEINKAADERMRLDQQRLHLEDRR